MSLVIPMIPLTGITSIIFRINKMKTKNLTIGISGENASIWVLGHLPLEWCCRADGSKLQNSKYDNKNSIDWEENNLVTLIADRDMGTLSYQVLAVDLRVAFSNEKIKYVPLHFAVNITNIEDEI